MTDDSAQSRWRAVARIDAFQIATSQKRSAVVIAGAFWSLAHFVRIARVAIRTVASCLVVSVGGAQCVEAALCNQAGVNALIVDAGLNQWTFVIVAATD